jgi:hypothetical protein
MVAFWWVFEWLQWLHWMILKQRKSNGMLEWKFQLLRVRVEDMSVIYGEAETLDPRFIWGEINLVFKLSLVCVGVLPSLCLGPVEAPAVDPEMTAVVDLYCVRINTDENRGAS